MTYDRLPGEHWHFRNFSSTSKQNVHKALLEYSEILGGKSTHQTSTVIWHFGICSNRVKNGRERGEHQCKPENPHESQKLSFLKDSLSSGIDRNRSQSGLSG
jgi:hypothetical protein